MTVPELKEKLRSLGLSLQGRKEDLVERLQSATQDASEEEAAEEAAEEAEADEGGVAAMTVPELKEKLRSLGLSMQGRKEDLVERLQSAKEKEAAGKTSKGEVSASKQATVKVAKNKEVVGDPPSACKGTMRERGMDATESRGSPMPQKEMPDCGESLPGGPGGQKQKCLKRQGADSPLPDAKKAKLAGTGPQPISLTKPSRAAAAAASSAAPAAATTDAAGSVRTAARGSSLSLTAKRREAAAAAAEAAADACSATSSDAGRDGAPKTPVVTAREACGTASCDSKASGGKRPRDVAALDSWFENGPNGW